MNNILLLLLGILFSAAAQIAIKIGVANKALSIENSLELLKIIPLWIGGILYAVAFVLYALILSRMDISYASPVMVAGVTVCITIAGALMGEEIDAARITGILLIVAGISAISYTA